MIKLRSLLKENKVSDYSFELGKYIMGLKPRIAGSISSAIICRQATFL